SILFTGRQSLLEAVTPMAICITESARHKSDTGERAFKCLLLSPGTLGIFSIKNDISTSGGLLTGEMFPEELNERFHAAATHCFLHSPRSKGVKRKRPT
ncbi:hypothetical protein JOQ06_008912, partial [Pogonophryne albipinna]